MWKNKNGSKMKWNKTISLKNQWLITVSYITCFFVDVQSD